MRLIITYNEKCKIHVFFLMRIESITIDNLLPMIKYV